MNIRWPASTFAPAIRAAVSGVAVLLAGHAGGCIPIPANSRYMENGRLKPGYVVGSDDHAIVRLGETPLNDAVERLAEYIAGPRPERPLSPGLSIRSSTDVKNEIMQLKGGRQYAFTYEYRTWYFYNLFLFGAKETETEPEFLVLTTDSNDVVIRAQTLSDVSPLFPADGVRTPFVTTRPEYDRN